jgi:hypothetical protein
MPTECVFVVGASRSGTTLMSRILNSSDWVTIANENHFLGHLVPWEGARYRFRKFGDLSDDDNVRKLVDYLYSGGFQRDSKHRPVSYHWLWIIEWVDKEDFLQRILETDRSDRALFTVMMKVYADHFGRPIMGEKTPAHLRYVSTLMEWFSNAKVIHMFRDPRGVFVSDLRRRKKLPVTFPFKQLNRFEFFLKLFIMLQTSAVWFEAVLRYHKYAKLYPNNYLLVKFEDLVTEPEKHIRRVCDFLEIEFQDKMLDQEVVSVGFRWKETGFDRNAATRWQEQIDPWIDRWFSFWFRKYLKEFGYSDFRSPSLESFPKAQRS